MSNNNNSRQMEIIQQQINKYNKTLMANYLRKHLPLIKPPKKTDLKILEVL